MVCQHSNEEDAALETFGLINPMNELPYLIHVVAVENPLKPEQPQLRSEPWQA